MQRRIVSNGAERIFAVLWVDALKLSESLRQGKASSSSCLKAPPDVLLSTTTANCRPRTRALVSAYVGEWPDHMYNNFGIGLVMLLGVGRVMMAVWRIRIRGEIIVWYDDVMLCSCYARWSLSCLIPENFIYSNTYIQSSFHTGGYVPETTV